MASKHISARIKNPKAFRFSIQTLWLDFIRRIVAEAGKKLLQRRSDEEIEAENF